MEVKRFKRRAMTVVIACTLLGPYAPTARGVQESSLPHLRREETATQLVVDGKAVAGLEQFECR